MYCRQSGAQAYVGVAFSESTRPTLAICFAICLLYVTEIKHSVRLLYKLAR
jgi:hypothetical protein